MGNRKRKMASKFGRNFAVRRTWLRWSDVPGSEWSVWRTVAGMSLEMGEVEKPFESAQKRDAGKRVKGWRIMAERQLLAQEARLINHYYRTIASFSLTKPQTASTPSRPKASAIGPETLESSLSGYIRSLVTFNDLATNQWQTISITFVLSTVENTPLSNGEIFSVTFCCFTR